EAHRAGTVNIRRVASRALPGAQRKRSRTVETRFDSAGENQEQEFTTESAESAEFRKNQGLMAHTIADLIPEYIRGLPAYIPGRPIEEVERELKIHAIKLASNENPIGPSPKAMEAVKSAVSASHRYPDGGTHLLRGK